MAKGKENGAVDASTEEKIKNAARIVFQKKGFAASRTRDIAEEAGINLALLNYYYRSKEKLFQIIMIETLTGFVHVLVSIFNDEDTSFEEKIELLANNYIDFAIEFPYVPIFIFSELRNHPEELIKTIPVRQMLTNSVFVRQFQKKVMAGEIETPNLLHFIMNLMGLVIFPIIGRPFLSVIGELDDQQFAQLMQERKKLIPAWVKAMFFTA